MTGITHTPLNDVTTGGIPARRCLPVRGGRLRQRGSAEVLQGFGGRLVLVIETSSSIVETSMARVLPRALEYMDDQMIAR